MTLTSLHGEFLKNVVNLSMWFATHYNIKCSLNMNVHQACICYFRLPAPKDCVEIDAARGAWRDVSCGEYRPFICKRKMRKWHLLALTLGDQSSQGFSWNSDRCFNFRHGQDNLH